MLRLLPRHLDAVGVAMSPCFFVWLVSVPDTRDWEPACHRSALHFRIALRYPRLLER